HDGLSGEILPGGDSLHGAGGYITGSAGGNIAIILDGTTQVDVGVLPDAGFYFFGLIDTSAAGFTRFEFRELDGKVGQERIIFGDDFIIASSGLLPGNTPPTQPGTLLASAVTDNSATVSWGASTDADPADTITYLVEYRRNGDFPWTSGGTTTTTSQALTGLDPAQSYDVQVTPNDGTDDGTARTTLNLFQTFAADDILFGDGFEGNP
ncbi:MAG: fibronectin type III domain-containing protein, partial [Xanthomonadales bacterium]|nr:fibronectin type III domain-containing protein [Xanthomonadales bacterium]